MPLSPDRRWRTRWPLLVICAVAAIGYGLTLIVFYPGIMTYDAKYVYQDIATGARGDWQSPVMTVLWGLIDPVAPGTASMFLLMATAYWLAFGLLAGALARHAFGVALLLIVLALLPPAFDFIGIIWRDMLFAIGWLLAAAIAFAAVKADARYRIPAQVLALALCAVGVLLRPNALIAAPILCAFVIWPLRMSLRRTALLFVPAMVGLFALVQVVYYGVLGAARQHPEQTIMVFDLGGISHFSGENQFPVDWSEPEAKLLLDGCYRPTQWDIYWKRFEPCEFVMRKIEREKRLFGTPAVTEAWVHAILHHPLAYLRHRTAFTWNFLTGDNLTMWLADVENPTENVFPERASFLALVSLHDWLKPTPLFSVGAWLLVCMVGCGAAWRRRQTPEGAFGLGVCGSAVLYVLTFAVVGVASDFRYGYWAVLAGIAGGVAALAPAKPFEPAVHPASVSGKP